MSQTSQNNDQLREESDVLTVTGDGRVVWRRYDGLLIVTLADESPAAAASEPD